MKLSEMAATLREIGVSPVKSLGQNFLHDRNLARWIVDHANLEAGDYVVEIGPGLGALTELVLTKGVHVLAIEKDRRLADFLRDRFQDRRLEILHADALKFDTRVLYTQRRAKVIGNLPYYVSSQLLLKFLHYPSPISFWLLMLQRELAERLVAETNSSDYGALTLQVQLHYRVDYLRSVPGNVFLPRPEVDSALVRILPRDPFELPACDYRVFETLVRLGFSQRRKQLGKLLREHAPDWTKLCRRLGLSSRVRAEELSLLQWIALVNSISRLDLGDAQTTLQEQLPVVDRHDQLVRTVPRREVHANKFLHRAVHILIFNKTEEVFLQKRARWKDRHPRLWDSSAAGHVTAGEAYEVAARREVREELGVDVALKNVAKLPATESTDYEFISLYQGSFEGELQPNPSEIEAGEFFPAKFVDGWIAARPGEFAPGFLNCWKTWRKTSR